MLVSNFDIGWDKSNLESALHLGGQTYYLSQTVYCLQVTNLEKAPIAFQFEFFFDGQTDRFWIQERRSQWSTHWGALSVRYTRVRGELYKGALRTSISGGESSKIILGLWNTHRTGYIGLRVPAGRGEDHFALGRQTEGAVRVLLHASQEIDTYRGEAAEWVRNRILNDDTFSREDGGDRTSASIALATGKADNEILAEDLITIGVTEFLDELQSGRRHFLDIAGATAIPEEDQVPALLDLLACLDPAHQELDALNRFLEEQGSPIRLSGRNG
jgi:hypothetical protein